MPKQPSGKDLINLTYALLVILGVLLILSRTIPSDIQDYAILFAGGVIFIIFAMLFSLKERL